MTRSTPATSSVHVRERTSTGISSGVGRGPIVRSRHFFGLREAQTAAAGRGPNSLVLSDEQRASATHPAIRQLIPLIPRANHFDANGTPRFVGSAPAIADSDRWTLDLRHSAGTRDRLQAFYGSQHVDSVEPLTSGNSIPGFGSRSHPFRNTLTIGETHTFGTATVNELRFGRNRLVGGTLPAASLNPTDFGIGNGVTRAIGLPQMIVAGDLASADRAPSPRAD